MTSTTITLDKELKSRLAPGYMENLGPAANWSLPVLAGAGGVRTTVNDLLLFAAANLAPPKNQLGKAIEMAWAVHQKPIADSDPLIGLGWHVQADGTRWHNGQTGGYHSMIMINRINKTSLVLMTNTATQEVDQLATDLMKMLSGAKVTPRKFEKPVDVSPEAMQKLVGKYELAPGAVFTVEVVDGKLMIGLTGQPSLPVLARSETVWFSKLVDATITFKQFKNGRYDSLVLNQGGVKQTAKRIDEPVNASQKGEKPVNVSADKVQKLVGKYEFSPGTVLTVETDEGKLMVRLTGQQSIQVFAHSDNIWYAKAVKATILFNLDKDGKCDSLVLLQNDTKQKAVRQKESTDVAQKDEKPIEVPVEALQKFVGTYELTPKLLFTVEATDGKLMIGLTGQPSHQVYPKSETVWFYKVVEATITFNLDKNGKCDSLVLFQNGAKQTAKRKK